MFQNLPNLLHLVSAQLTVPFAERVAAQLCTISAAPKPPTTQSVWFPVTNFELTPSQGRSFARASALLKASTSCSRRAFSSYSDVSPSTYVFSRYTRCSLRYY